MNAPNECIESLLVVEYEFTLTEPFNEEKPLSRRLLLSASIP